MKKIKKFLYSLFFTICLILINGCGQTGDLYLPEEAHITFKKNEYRS